MDSSSLTKYLVERAQCIFVSLMRWCACMVTNYFQACLILDGYVDILSIRKVMLAIHVFTSDTVMYCRHCVRIVQFTPLLHSLDVVAISHAPSSNSKHNSPIPIKAL